MVLEAVALDDRKLQIDRGFHVVDLVVLGIVMCVERSEVPGHPARDL